jgi:hypothetical protein
MTRPRRFFLPGLAFVLLLATACGIWWYLFQPDKISAAELLPAQTIFLAEIPNGAAIFDGYQTSHLKTLVDSPNSQPLKDELSSLLGTKNLDLLNAFAPNLSGQSFIAVTHFDYDHPEQVGLLAAMKPKMGLGNFNAFLEKLKTTWPEMLSEGKTGTGSVAGVGYRWIQGPGASDKICVAQAGGWIVTAWGEATLKDWIERFQRKSATPSLAQNPEYQTSLARVGADPMTLVYINYEAVSNVIRRQAAQANPAPALPSNLTGAAALTARFENGEIIDRYSLPLPSQTQPNSRAGLTACPFDTLKFTGPDTCFYWASTFDWKQYYKIRGPQRTGAPPAELPSVTLPADLLADQLLTFLTTRSETPPVAVEHNIIDALGSEFSVQLEWDKDSTYPSAGLFLKLDHADDFQAVITAIIDSVRKAYATSAVIEESNVNGQKFATLKFLQAALITPTITENGPYLGIFLGETQALHSFQRDPSFGLAHNADFERQVGDKQNGASEIIFLDSPRLLDHAYRTAMPYLSVVSMFNKDVAGFLKGRTLPPDLSWLTPMDTWSFVMTPDPDGLKAYSISGIGNQGIFLGVAGATIAAIWNPFAKLLAPPVNASGAPASGSTAGTSAVNAGDSATSVIEITPHGRLLFDHTPVDAAQLGNFLKAKRAGNEDLKLAVKVDKNAPSTLLPLVMDAGASAGFGVLPYLPDADTAPAPHSAGTTSKTHAIPAATQPVQNH